MSPFHMIESSEAENDAEGCGSQMKSVLEQRLHTFFDLFDSTLELTEDLIASRSHAQELLILLCSRLDALACSSVAINIPRKKRLLISLPITAAVMTCAKA